MQSNLNPGRYFWLNVQTASRILILMAAATAVPAAVQAALVFPTIWSVPPKTMGPLSGPQPAPAPPVPQTWLPADSSPSVGPIFGPLPSKPTPATPIISTSADVAALVSGDNQFAYDLFGALSSTNTGNLVFSPYSISTALAMTYAGARGQTATEMAQTLRFTFPQNQVSAAMGQLINETNAPTGAAYQLNVANQLWGQTGKSFLPSFLNMMSTDYRAPLSELDFKDSPESARNTINTWTANQTNQKIQNLMPQGSITPATQLVLTNAIYFNGQWASPFTTSLTSPENFQLASGSVESVSMMHQESSFSLKYGAFQNFSMLEMPYQGSDLSMLVILPNTANGLPAVEKSLNAQTLDQDENKLSFTDVKVGLPKFTVNSGFGLGGTLSNMGMPAAFSNAADFSGMDGQPDLKISSVMHKAFINVNEAGTEAAAATGVGFVGTVVAYDPTPPAVFDADHPFDYLIVDNKTGSLLFMGRVTDPGGTLLSAPLAEDSFFSDPYRLLSSSLESPLAAIDFTLSGSPATSIPPPSGLPAISAVPEPSTFVLMLGGILGLVLFARRSNSGQKN